MKKSIKLFGIIIATTLLLISNKSHSDTNSYGNFVIFGEKILKISNIEYVEYYHINTQGEEVFLSCDSINGVIIQLPKSFEINLIDTDSSTVQLFGAFNRPPIKFSLGKTVYFGKSFFINYPNQIHEITYVTYEYDSVIELHDLSEKTIIKFHIKE